MKKILCFLLCCICSSKLCAITPLRSLPPLNKALFKTPLHSALTRQTFAQLQTAHQLEAFSQAERALLLTHKFIAENHHWPRTVIARNGQLVATTQYTLAEQQETDLGKLLRRTLETSHQTPPAIRAELENLKTRFSPARTNQFMLEALNHWLSVQGSWPRAEITSTGPLSKAELAEMELARYANKITAEYPQTLPKELVTQIRFIRALYDPSFHPFEEENKQDRFYQLLERTYAWLGKNHTWPNSYAPATWEEGNLAYKLEAALQQDINAYPAVLELAYLKNYYQSFVKLPAEMRNPLIERPKDFYYTKETQLPRTLQRQRIYPTPTFPAPKNYALPRVLQEEPAYAVVLKLVDWLKHHRAWPHLHAITADPHEIQLAKNIQEMSKLQPGIFKKLRDQWVNRPPSLYLAQLTPADELLTELKRWTVRHNRWPRAQKVLHTAGGQILRVPEEEYTPADIAETSLAKRVDAFATYADEFEQGQWKQHPSVSGTLRLLDLLPYNNPALEQFRQLYQQYNHDY